MRVSVPWEMKLFIIWENVTQYIGKKRKTLQATSAVLSSLTNLSSQEIAFLRPDWNDGRALSRSKPLRAAIHRARKQLPMTPP
jgi:hypothetical protein